MRRADKRGQSRPKKLSRKERRKRIKDAVMAAVSKGERAVVSPPIEEASDQQSVDAGDWDDGDLASPAAQSRVLPGIQTELSVLDQLGVATARIKKFEAGAKRFKADHPAGMIAGRQRDVLEQELVRFHRLQRLPPQPSRTSAIPTEKELQEERDQIQAQEEILAEVDLLPEVEALPRHQRDLRRGLMQDHLLLTQQNTKAFASWLADQKRRPLLERSPLLAYESFLVFLIHHGPWVTFGLLPWEKAIFQFISTFWPVQVVSTRFLATEEIGTVPTSGSSLVYKPGETAQLYSTTVSNDWYGYNIYVSWGVEELGDLPAFASHLSPPPKVYRSTPVEPAGFNSAFSLIYVWSQDNDALYIMDTNTLVCRTRVANPIVGEVMCKFKSNLVVHERPAEEQHVQSVYRWVKMTRFAPHWRIASRFTGVLTTRTEYVLISTEVVFAQLKMLLREQRQLSLSAYVRAVVQAFRDDKVLCAFYHTTENEAIVATVVYGWNTWKSGSETFVVDTGEQPADVITVADVPAVRTLVLNQSLKNVGAVSWSFSYFTPTALRRFILLLSFGWLIFILVRFTKPTKPAPPGEEWARIGLIVSVCVTVVAVSLWVFRAICRHHLKSLNKSLSVYTGSVGRVF